VGCAVARALVILPEALALRDNRRQKDRALGFTWFAGKGPCAQRSISADLIYSRIVCFFQGVHEVATLSFGSFHQGKE